MTDSLSPRAQIILNSIPKLSAVELERVRAFLSLVEDNAPTGEDGREDRAFLQFYAVFRALLQREGCQVPEVWALRKIKRIYTAVQKAWRAVELTLKHYKIAPTYRAHAIGILYSLGRNRMRKWGKPATIYSCAYQLRNSSALLEEALPGYPLGVIREVLTGHWSAKEARNRRLRARLLKK